jgi:hypothetical protein
MFGSQEGGKEGKAFGVGLANRSAAVAGGGCIDTRAAGNHPIKQNLPVLPAFL